MLQKDFVMRKGLGLQSGWSVDDVEVEKLPWDFSRGVELDKLPERPVPEGEEKEKKLRGGVIEELEGSLIPPGEEEDEEFK